MDTLSYWTRIIKKTAKAQGAKDSLDIVAYYDPDARAELDALEVTQEKRFQLAEYKIIQIGASMPEEYVIHSDHQK